MCIRNTVVKVMKSMQYTGLTTKLVSEILFCTYRPAKIHLKYWQKRSYLKIALFNDVSEGSGLCRTCGANASIKCSFGRWAMESTWVMYTVPNCFLYCFDSTRFFFFWVHVHGTTCSYQQMVPTGGLLTPDVIIWWGFVTEIFSC